VLHHGADLGIALDGDGDRVIMVDEKGEVVDGDELIFIIAQSRQQSGELSGGVVGTQMSNFGLEQSLGSLKIPFERARVGDRYVLEALVKNGWKIGGESSGHILCLDRTTTGDGIAAALQVVAVMMNTGRTLHELKMGMHKYPQSMVNVRLSEGGSQRPDLNGNKTIQSAIKMAEDKLAGNGRVLLRPSGTEPLVRVMVEGQDPVQVDVLVHELAQTVETALKA